MRINTLIIATKILFLMSCAEKNKINYDIHTFYYGWYGNEETDGSLRHWNHDILPHWNNKSWDNKTAYRGGDDIGANFYPFLSSYSNNDTVIVKKHIEMIQEAGVGVICLSWWGKGSYEDNNVSMIMDLADKKNIKVNFHLEPLKNRTAESTMEMVRYLISKYGEHNAFYRINGKPLFYVYDSYIIPKDEWSKVLTTGSIKSIRGTKFDSYIIGLWVNRDEGDFFIDGGFDGIYTYFASDGFTYGSSKKNWNYLSSWADSNNKIFIPCVGPGYSDSRIRPWNKHNYKDRDSGNYYDNMFETAIKSKPRIIGVTSFNEWHEGTQIEPAISKVGSKFIYEDYAPRDPSYYLRRTKYWTNKFEVNDNN